MRPRIIPVLLLSGRRLVKTLRFADPRYIGDPVNAVRIFNDKEVDELVLLDIDATREGRPPDIDYIAEVAAECFMPFAYGGGLRSVEEAAAILKAGAEKIVLNAAAVENPGLVSEAAEQLGSQSVVAAMDVRLNPRGEREVFIRNGSTPTGLDPVRHAIRMEELGAGELFVNSIDRDGVMGGYDIELVRSVSGAVGIPVIASGGAGSLEDFGRVIRDGGASAAAAGSHFVFCGSRDAVLITYPDVEELESLGFLESVTK